MSSNQRRSRRFGRRRSLLQQAETAELRVAKYNTNLSLDSVSPMRFSTSLRYQFTTVDGTTASITYASLLNLVTVTKTTTTATSLLEAVKVNRLRVWVMGKTGTPVAPVSTYEFMNSCLISIRDAITPGVGVEKEITVMAPGSQGKYYEYRPKGLASQWFNGVGSSPFLGQILFALTPSVGHAPIVQIDVSMQVAATTTVSGSNALVLQTTVDATTAGGVAYPYLDSMSDGDTEGTQVLQPLRLGATTVNLPLPAPVSTPAPARPSMAAIRAAVSSSSSGRPPVAVTPQ